MSSDFSENLSSSQKNTHHQRRVEKQIPNFKHRLEPDIDNPLGLADTVGMMTSRAIGILKLLIINQENGGIVAEDIVVAAISAVIAEINDIDATVAAFYTATIDAETQSVGGAQ
jgi:hypothetical protein